MRQTGHADLPLHTGVVPKWLADRMMQLGTLITESLVINFGKKEFLRRLSDPLWFQSLGSVMGMDWHSSGITTSVMRALQRGLNPRARELGIVVCGGRGKYSRKTPEELLFLADMAGLDGEGLVKSSKLCAKVDNNAVQDGFQLYLHNFVVTDEGDWSIVQQGMNVDTKTARRYHWCSLDLKSYVQEPHSGVVGENRGKILNLIDSKADSARKNILSLSVEKPELVLKEASLINKTIVQKENELDLWGAAEERNLVMPAHHEVRKEDVNLKRLGAVLAVSNEANPQDFESLLLTPGLGPRTLQSLALVSEVIYGTPSRFNDPARFSFAHGGKDGHPFPVPTKIYDETIRVLGDCIEQSRLGYDDKSKCLQRLYKTQLEIEENCAPQADFEQTILRERLNSKNWGGRVCGQ